MSFTNKENKIRHVISPCKRPMSLAKKSDTLFICFTHNSIIQYNDFHTLNIFPSSPSLIVLYHFEFLLLNRMLFENQRSNNKFFFYFLFVLNLILIWHQYINSAAIFFKSKLCICQLIIFNSSFFHSLKCHPFYVKVLSPPLTKMKGIHLCPKYN